ncbi:Uncharacterised protein [uncultured archaeon]|nr:Uncharacterised protein [uncultured archaeon]
MVANKLERNKIFFHPTTGKEHVVTSEGFTKLQNVLNNTAVPKKLKLSTKEETSLISQRNAKIDQLLRHYGVK